MEVERLAAQNPWWKDGSAILDDAKVKKVLATGEKVKFALGNENLVLVGPRQLGKTTALKYDIYTKITRQGVDPAAVLYYSFDTSRNFEEISDVIDTFMAGEGRKYLYLDEVSFVEGWQRAVKRFLDSEKSARATLYVTGSSSINLKKELMPGRNIKFAEFMPLSFRDFVISFGTGKLKGFIERNSAKTLDDAVRIAAGALPYFEEVGRLFSTYIATGGYPDAIFDYMSNGKVSDDIYDIHWNAFISDVSKSGKSIEIATAVVYGILQSYSSRISLSSIARMQGVKSHVTVREYIEAFSDLFMAKSIFPVSGKRYAFRKERKVYFNDPFIYAMLAKKLGFVDANSEPKIVEGILHSHLHRFINSDKSLAEPETAIGFYSGKREVDFVFGGFGLEMKWQNDVAESDFPDYPFKKRILLSKKTLDAGKKGYNGVDIVPLPLFLLSLQ